MARNYLWGSFSPEQRAAGSFCPEIKWLAFAQKQSRGGFCRRAGEKDVQAVPEWADDKTRTFDPRGEFLPKYATRRANLEGYNTQHNAIRVRPEHMARRGEGGGVGGAREAQATAPL